MHVVELEKPIGVIVQFGGQTAINLASGLEKRGVKILGTSLEAIDRAEDRHKFEQLLDELNLLKPNGKAVTTKEKARSEERRVGKECRVRKTMYESKKNNKIRE